MAHAKPLIISKSGYMNVAFRDPVDIAGPLRDALEGIEYDTLVGTGLSGALVIPGLARELGKLWAIVRKPTDQSHSDKVIEGEVGAYWLFVDDFTDTGATRRRVEAAIEKASNRESPFVKGSYYTPRLPVPIMVGAYYYTHQEFGV